MHLKIQCILEITPIHVHTIPMALTQARHDSENTINFTWLVNWLVFNQMESYVPLKKHVHKVDYPPVILLICLGMFSKIMEGKKCNFRASASSASMIVVFLSYYTNNLVAIFFL